MELKDDQNHIPDGGKKVDNRIPDPSKTIDDLESI